MPERSPESNRPPADTRKVFEDMLDEMLADPSWASKDEVTQRAVRDRLNAIWRGIHDLEKAGYKVILNKKNAIKERGSQAGIEVLLERGGKTVYLYEQRGVPGSGRQGDLLLDGRIRGFVQAADFFNEEQ